MGPKNTSSAGIQLASKLTYSPTTKGVSAADKKAFDAVSKVVLGQPTGGQGGYSGPSTVKQTKAPATDPLAAHYAALSAATREQTALLRAQLAAAPKLIKYDTAGAANAAYHEAVSAVTPLYVDKLNNYLAKETVARNAEKRHAGEAITDAEDNLKALTEGNATTRSRTGEDTATKIGETDYMEGQYQDTSGTAFDEARNALAEGTAAAGLAESGLGSQRLDSQQAAQATESNQQAHKFEQVRKTAKLFESRTIEDLAKSDAAGTLQRDKTTGRVKLDLEDFLETSTINERITRGTIEAERQAAIMVDSSQRQRNKAREFIAQLQQRGARPQDIALAAQIYGAGG